jgi:DNA (cytosine-5)-methyltransferase 1
VTDPVYGYSMPARYLSGHFGDTTLGDAECQRIRRVKTEHPYMGRMDFPDRTDRPARTVVATQLGRETLVLDSGRGRFRRPTIRECACIQSFPISYQFYGRSASAQYRQVGDAVPPKLAYAIAREIGRQLGALVSEPRLHLLPIASVSTTAIQISTPRVHKHAKNRRFARMIPGKEIRGCRVEFDNRGSSLLGDSNGQHGARVMWSARLYVGEGRSGQETDCITFETAAKELLREARFADAVEIESAVAFLRDGCSTLQRLAPCGVTLQRNWVAGTSGPGGPDQLCDAMCEVVNRYFPLNKFGDVRIRPTVGPKLPGRGIKIRLWAGLILAAAAAQLANDVQDPDQDLSRRNIEPPHFVPDAPRELLHCLDRLISESPSICPEFSGTFGTVPRSL